MNLYEKLAQEVSKWRSQGYPSESYSFISEILQWSNNADGEGFRLRIPQVRALEAYWYLRLCEGTPHTSELYRKLYPRSTELLAALGLDYPEIKDSVIADVPLAHLIKLNVAQTWNEVYFCPICRHVYESFMALTVSLQ